MKVKVYGCPSHPELVIDVSASATFRDAISKAETSTGAKLAGFYTIHLADAKGVAVMEAPADDPLSSMGITDGGALRLVPTGSAPPKAKATPRERMVALYQKYDPSKVGTVDAMLAKFPGREEAVIKKLVEKYGPEPEQVSTEPTPAATPAATPAVTPRAATATPSAQTPRASASGLSHKERMVALYQKYDPSKVGTVDAMLAKFPGREEAVIKKLVDKYGPEPVAEHPTAPAAASPAKAKAPPSAALSKGPSPALSPAPSPAPSPRPEPASSMRDRIVALYNHYDPAKVGTVDALLAKYVGKEEQILAKMVEKYGPEPQTGVAAATTEAEQLAAKQATGWVDPELRARVLRYLEVKVPSHASKVDDIIAKFGGGGDVMEKLINKYGPEPDAQNESSNVSTPTDSLPMEPPKTRSETVAPQDAGPIIGGNASVPPTPPPPPPPPSIDRYRGALRALVDRMAKEAEQRALSAHFTLWLKLVASRRAKTALANGAAIVKGDGRFEIKSRQENTAAEGGQFIVPSLEEFFFSHVKRGTDNETAISKALGGALQRFASVAVSSCSNAQPFTVPQILSAKECIPVRDTAEIAHFVVSAASALETRCTSLATEKISLSNTLTETRGELARTATSLSDLRLYVQELEKQAEADRTTLLRLSGVERDLAASLEREEQMQRAIEILKQAQILEDERNAKMRHENIRLKKELADERRGLPSDMEVLLSQKDSTIASLQQELAKVRTKARGAKGREDELLETIKELNEKVRQLELSRSLRRGASASASPRANASPRFIGASSSSTAQYGGYSAPSLRLTSEGSHSPAHRTMVGTSQSEQRLAFEPAARPPPFSSSSEADATYLAEEDDPTLDVEVQKKALLPDRGPCPHCLIPLTAFMGDRYGCSPDDAAKVAFCFSCRRSFTGVDLARRDAKARAAKSALGAKTLSQARI